MRPLLVVGPTALTGRPLVEAGPLPLPRLIETTRPPQVKAIGQPVERQDLGTLRIVLRLSSEGHRQGRLHTTRLATTRHPIGPSFELPRPRLDPTIARLNGPNAVVLEGIRPRRHASASY